VVISEFARTPALNGARGKDHNPMTNSVLFAGHGIQKGKTVRASLLIVTIAKICGVDMMDFRSAPRTTKFIPGIAL
jgi:uncharacterized protein (DUF1501 family)